MLGVVTVFIPYPKMEDADAFEDDVNYPRRSLRLALTEINELAESPNVSTPSKVTNPDEMIIIQRGPRKKPITWSPVEYDRSKLLLSSSREKTPEPTPPKRSDINPRLRRRLVLSPSKGPSQELGMIIAKKLRSLKSIEKPNL